MRRAATPSVAARQLRWGQLIGALEVADVSLRIGRRALDLLTPEDIRLFDNAMSIVVGLQQRAWIAQTIEASPARKQRKKP